MKRLGFVMLLAACSFQASPSGQTPGDDGSGSGGVDASGGGGGGGGGGGSDAGKPPPDAQQCFGVGLLANLCLDAAPTDDKTLAAMSFDTGGGSCTKVVTQTGGPDLCIVAGKTIKVTGAFVATGSRALVMIAADTLTVQAGGSIDVSSRTSNGARSGAAANTGTCSTLNHGGADRGGGGGGAGGSFGTVGGKGGVGDNNDSDQPNGSAAGGAVGMAQATPAILRGGCPGSAGGDASTDQTKTGGAGGNGGGAVYLIAVNTITLDGDVFASGAGGVGQPNGAGAEQGGGGGGTGGMIGLDARTIAVNAASGHVVANGGGGGGGGSLNQGGTAGGDGTTTSWNARASAGAGDVNQQSGNGGNGAMGTAINVSAGLDGSDSGGGGGGGAGGLGVIWTWGTLTGTMISPASVTH